MSGASRVCHSIPGRTGKVLESGKCEPSSKRQWTNVGEFSMAKDGNSREREYVLQRTYQFSMMCIPKKATLKSHLHLV